MNCVLICVSRSVQSLKNVIFDERHMHCQWREIYDVYILNNKCLYL